jgi:hypothetical protein
MYLLRLALLGNKTVIFEAREIGRVFAFVQSESGDYTVFDLELDDWNSSWSECSAIKYWETMYLVDPKDGQPDPPKKCFAATVLAASIQAGQVGKMILRKYWMFTWTLTEIIEARPYLGTTLTQEQLVERFTHVGGVPGLLLRQGCQYSINRITAAVARLDETALKIVLEGDMNGVDDKSFSAVLFMLVPNDPQKEFRDNNVRHAFISEGAMIAVCSKFADFIARQFNSALSEETTLMGHIFDRIAIDVFNSNVPLQSKRLTDRVELSSHECSLAAPAGLKFLDKKSRITRPLHNETVSDFISSWALPTRGLLLVPPATTARCGFQMTVAEMHPITGRSLQQFLPSQSGDPVHPESGGRLRWVFVVPWYRFSKFRAQPVPEPTADCEGIKIEQWKVSISEKAIKNWFRELVAPRKRRLVFRCSCFCLEY